MKILGGHASGATFSDDHVFRYKLWRRWGTEKLWLRSRDLVVIGLNPSTADHTQDDPTIRRCMGYAKAWAYNGLVMLNLFAFRATDPKDMKMFDNPVGPDNDWSIDDEVQGRRVLLAWGAHGSYWRRDEAVLSIVKKHGTPMHLGLTKSGQPKHPLYLAADLIPEAWKR